MVAQSSLERYGAETGEVEALTWRDIEILPYYAAGGLTLAAVGQVWAELGPALQGMTLKTLAIVILVGLGRRWLGSGA